MKPLYETLAEAIAAGDTCPNCNGRGEVLIKDVRKRRHSDEERIDMDIPCPMCDGTGNILCIEEVELPTLLKEQAS